MSNILGKLGLGGGLVCLGRGWCLRWRLRFAPLLDQTGDGRIAGARLQAEQQAGVKQRLWRARQARHGWNRAVLALGFGPPRRNLLFGLVLDRASAHGQLRLPTSRSDPASARRPRPACDFVDSAGS